VLEHEAVSVSTSWDGKDWNIGVLELSRDGLRIDVCFS
jgi:hypothetical protein